MTKKILLFLFFCLSVKAANAQAFNYKTYPTYDSIINYLRKNYIVDNTGLGLARKPDGWYVLSRHLQKEFGEQPVEYLLWSGADESYLPLKGHKGVSHEWWPDDYLLDSYNFQMLPYWGYENWYRDVIQIFENKLLNDTLTYALGEAYSRQAEAYLWPTGGLKYAGAFTKAQYERKDIDEYIKDNNRSIQYFKKTALLTPLFETLEGNITTRYSNECMDAFYSLTVCGWKEEATQFLKDSLYDEAINTNSRNVLLSCPENALLITNGDEGTGPLLYDQEKLGIRSDVKICNYSLLIEPRYIHYLRINKELPFTITDSAYLHLYNKVVYMDSTAETVPMEEVIGGVSALLSKYSDTYPSIRSNHIFYSFTSTDNFSQKGFLSTITLNYDSKYLWPYDLALLDLLYSGTIKINICFTGPSNEASRPYKKYMQVRGLVYEFTGTSYQNLDAKSDVTGLNVGKTLPLLQKDFKYNFKTNDSALTKNLVDCYKGLFIECIKAITTEGNNKTGIELVEEYISLFPANDYNYGSKELLLAEECVNLSDFSVLNSICQDLIKEGNKYAAGLKGKNTIPDTNDLVPWLFISNQVRAEYNKYIEKRTASAAMELYNTLLHYYK